MSCSDQNSTFNDDSEQVTRQRRVQRRVRNNQRGRPQKNVFTNLYQKIGPIAGRFQTGYQKKKQKQCIIAETLALCLCAVINLCLKDRFQLHSLIQKEIVKKVQAQKKKIDKAKRISFNQECLLLLDRINLLIQKIFYRQEPIDKSFVLELLEMGFQQKNSKIGEPGRVVIRGGKIEEGFDYIWSILNLSVENTSENLAEVGVQVNQHEILENQINYKYRMTGQEFIETAILDQSNPVLTILESHLEQSQIEEIHNIFAVQSIASTISVENQHRI